MKMTVLKKLDNSLLNNLSVWSLLNSVILFGVIVLGVSISAGTGGPCPDWPACFGEISPPGETGPLLDYLHRAYSGFALVMQVLVLRGISRQQGFAQWGTRITLLSLLLLLGQVIFGAVIAISELQLKWAGSVHLLVSLVILSLSLGVTVSAFMKPNREGIALNNPIGRQMLAATALVFGIFVSGSVVAITKSTSTCAAWPLCLPGQDFTPDEWLNFVHRIIVGIGGISLLRLTVTAWNKQRQQPVVLVSVTAAMVLFTSLGMTGSLEAKLGYPLYLVSLHAATAAATWAALVTAMWTYGYAENQTLLIDQFSKRSIRRLALDFLMLTKPIVVVLLLVTTFAGMVIGAQSWPELGLVFWTMLGGFLAAGGSGAINQYIDRADDEKMQRTNKRPIPAGRLTPAEGLAFGVAVSILSFYLLVYFVNILAALLSLAGIIYYVVLYSLILKKTTVQNIVIGGGAGAIPPLVGWAAATGNLTLPSLLLFAIVFLWTPPHFWELAIVRRKDYERAGIPMLPVVRGERETRYQVFIYTLELVALTLLLPLLGLGGSIYLISASLLGVFLIYSAHRVWKVEGNKIAWKMYRYSSMYLAFLFLALMIDRLLLV